MPLSCGKYLAARRCYTVSAFPLRCCLMATHGIGVWRSEVATASGGEWEEQLGGVGGWVVRFGGHTELGGVEPAGGIVGVGAHQVVPDQGEQAEVDVTDAGPFEVMEAVAFIECQHILRGPVSSAR